MNNNIIYKNARVPIWGLFVAEGSGEWNNIGNKYVGK